MNIRSMKNMHPPLALHQIRKIENKVCKAEHFYEVHTIF